MITQTSLTVNEPHTTHVEDYTDIKGKDKTVGAGFFFFNSSTFKYDYSLVNRLHMNSYNNSKIVRPSKPVINIIVT